MNTHRVCWTRCEYAFRAAIVYIDSKLRFLVFESKVYICATTNRMPFNTSNLPLCYVNENVCIHIVCLCVHFARWVCVCDRTLSQEKCNYASRKSRYCSCSQAACSRPRYLPHWLSIGTQLQVVQNHTYTTRIVYNHMPSISALALEHSIDAVIATAERSQYRICTSRYYRWP